MGDRVHIWYHRRWRRPNNHLDARHCPDCGATVHGNMGQSVHLRWHVKLAELFAGTGPGDGENHAWSSEDMPMITPDEAQRAIEAGVIRHD